eukprot:EG_transcript_12153
MNFLKARAKVDGAGEVDHFKAHEGALHSLHEGEESASGVNQEQMKRTHFNSFFAEQHSIRNPLREGTSLTEVITILWQGIRLLNNSRLWLKCFWSLKLHIRAKLRMRTFWLNRRKERDEMLLEMFNFWMDAEKKRSAQVRKAMQDLANSSPEKYKQRSAQLSSIWTPDSVKSTVVWELYWLLRQQLLHNAAHHMRDKNRLMFARRKALADLQDRRGGSREALQEANAALFVLFLQTPSLKFGAKHFPFSTLVQLARFATSPDHGAVVPSCRIFTAFLVLPVCDSAAWLQKRRFMPYPLVPPISPDCGLPSGQAPGHGPDSDDGAEDTEALLRPSSSAHPRRGSVLGMGRNVRPVKCRSSSIVSTTGPSPVRAKSGPSLETDGPSDSDSEEEEPPSPNTGGSNANNSHPSRRAITNHGHPGQGGRRDSVQHPPPMALGRRRSSSVVSMHGPRVVKGSGPPRSANAAS